MMEYLGNYETPADDVTLYRYMDASQFLSLLSTGMLHFTRLDQFEDKWEGVITEPDWNEVVQSKYWNDKPGELQEFKEGTEYLRFSVFVNCWHENEFESEAMWKLYGHQGSNIAVVTSMKNLRASMENDKEQKIYCGRVEYIDHKKDSVKTKDYLKYCISKRKSFAHEREVRLVLHMPDFDEEQQKGGINVKVELNQLINQILVSPKAPEWYVSALRDVSEKFGIQKGLVIRSSLDDGPIR